MLEDYEAKPDLLVAFSWERAPACVGFADLDPSDALAERVWMLGWPEYAVVGGGRYPKGGSPVHREIYQCIDDLMSAARYDPLDIEHGALFLNFAELATKNGAEFERACATFAATYGLLGLEESLPSVQVWNMEGLCYTQGESLASWRAAADFMHLAVRLWQADSDTDLARKKQALSWTTQWLDRKLGAKPTTSFALLHTPASLDASESTLRLPSRKGNAYTKEYRQALLAEITNVFLANGLSHAVTVDDEKKRYSLQVIPDSLWRLMWYQLAQAQGAVPGFLRCHRCGRWRVRHSGVARGNRRYCDQACKQLAYEQRRKRAVELHFEDPTRTAAMITAALAEEEGYRATRPDTVAKWIASSGT